MKRESLKYIAPEQLRDWWEYVKHGLERVQEKGGADRWIAEDVYMALKSGKAHLHVSMIGHAPHGFVILQPVNDYDGINLHMWIGYSESPGASEAHLPEIREYARNMGAKRVTFETRRPGWQRVAKRYGYRVANVNYELPVESEH